jgi:hypothetical protein
MRVNQLKWFWYFCAIIISIWRRKALKSIKIKENIPEFPSRYLLDHKRNVCCLSKRCLKEESHLTKLFNSLISKLQLLALLSTNIKNLALFQEENSKGVQKSEIRVEKMMPQKYHLCLKNKTFKKMDKDCYRAKIKCRWK